jgi:hypothetical protein
VSVFVGLAVIYIAHRLLKEPHRPARADFVLRVKLENKTSAFVSTAKPRKALPVSNPRQNENTFQGRFDNVTAHTKTPCGKTVYASNFQDRLNVRQQRRRSVDKKEIAKPIHASRLPPHPRLPFDFSPGTLHHCAGRPEISLSRSCLVGGGGPLEAGEPFPELLLGTTRHFECVSPSRGTCRQQSLSPLTCDSLGYALTSCYSSSSSSTTSLDNSSASTPTLALEMGSDYHEDMHWNLKIDDFHTDALSPLPSPSNCKLFME